MTHELLVELFTLIPLSCFRDALTICIYDYKIRRLANLTVSSTRLATNPISLLPECKRGSTNPAGLTLTPKKE